MTFNKRILGGLMALILFLESFSLAGAQASDLGRYNGEAGLMASRQANYNFLQNAGLYQDRKSKNINADEKAVTKNIDSAAAEAATGSPAEAESGAVKEAVSPSDTAQGPSAVFSGDEAVPEAEEAATAIGIPGNVKVSAGERTIAVSWDGVPGAQGYELSLNGNVTRVTAAYFNFDKQEANTQYFLKVRAFSEDQAGEWSREQECHTLLSAPVGLSATQSSIFVELAWQPSKGAAGYRIYRNDTEIGYSAVNTYTDIRLEAFDTYIYRVKAVNEAGNASELSEGCRVENTAAQQAQGTVAEPAAPQEADSITPAGIQVPEVQDMEVLPAPSDLTAKASCDCLLVSFSPVDGAESYEVSLDDNIISTTGSSLAIDNLTSNTRHVLKVRALSSQGNSEWGDSITVYTLLVPPSRLIAAVSGTAINLTWDASEGAATYEIYRNAASIGTSDTNTYTDAGLSCGQTYVYTVKAFSAQGNESEPSSASALCEIMEAPAVPADINVISTDKTITISFQPSDRAAGYDISLDGIISHTSQPGCTIGELTPNRQYAVRVRAVNGGGSSQWSSEIYKYTLLPTPGNVAAVPSMTSVELKWSPVEGAASYEIYRDDIQIGTAASNIYNDTGLLQGKTYTYKIKAKNESGNESAYSAAVTAATLAATYISSDMKLTEDKVFGDVYLNGGTLDLNGYRMTVRGNLIQPGGVLKINGGQLIVAGDYTISKGQSDCYAILDMTNNNDYIIVKGNFLMQSYLNHELYLTAGILEVKGNFTQKPWGKPTNFTASGTHKVLLSGNTLQTVHFENPGSSKFNILIITKPMDSGYSFNSYSVWNVLIEDYRYQQYFGQSGTNPATGNFSRSYTDLTMEAPGYDINFTRTYNSRSSKTSGFGKGWSFSYEGSVRDAQNNPNAKEVSLPDGSVQSFRKNSDGSFTASDSHNVLVKNPDGTYTLTSKQQDVFSFDANGYLVKIQDKNGNSVNITVDSQGKATVVTDQAGRHFTVSYENNLIKNIRDDTNNRTISYEYTGSHLTCVTDAMGNNTIYAYDTEGRIAEIRDSLDGITEEVSYISSGENKGKVNKRTDINGNTFTYTYDNINCVTTITDSNGRVTREKYDGSYSIINSTDAEGKSTVYEYSKDATGINKYGEEKAVTDRNGNKTQYDRDSNGNVTKVTNPDSSTKLMTYDDKNNLTSERDESGKYTFYIYDSGKKNLIKKVQPLNGTDQYVDGSSDISKFAITVYTYYQEAESQELGYRARGLVKSETDPESSTVTYTYDVYGNIKTRTDAEGNTSTFQYNTQSQVTAALTPRGNCTEYIYDKNGSLEKQVADGDKVTRITYDLEGRKTKEVSPEQYEPSKDDIQNHSYNADTGYRYTYFANGKIKTSTDPENYTTAYTYDIYGNLETETKPNSSKYIYQYDLMNRPLRIYFKADASVEQQLLEEYTYEILAGGKTRQTCKQYLNDTDVAITVKTCDYAGRVLSEARPDGTAVAAAYNTNGTTSYTTDANGNITYYKYDGLNRQTEQWTPFETAGGSTRYTYVKAVYDKAGKRLQEMAGSETVLQNQIPGSFITKTYDYYKNGKIKSITDNEGRRTEYLYDADGNVSRERVYTSAAEYNTTYYHNNYLGKVIEKREYVKAGDLAGDYVDGTLDIALITTYTYDKNGNLKTVTAPDLVSTTYTYDGRNLQTSAAQPGRDEYGNPAELKTTTAYNWQGQPVETTDANGNTTRYSYDKRGLLVKITDAAGNTTAYYYDRAGRKTAEVAPVDYEPSKSLENMNRVEYTYDLMGRVTTKTYAGEERRYDPSTKLWTAQTVTIVQSACKYDSSGNLIKELDSLGYEAASDKTGAAARINTGYGTEYTYNLANKVIAVLDPVSKERGLAYTTKYGYDALGRRITEIDANGVVTGSCYDGAGNITKITVRKTANAPEQIIAAKTWDFQGRLLTETDANGNVTTYEYNALGQVRRAVYPGDASIPANEITCLYDEMGRLKTQKDSRGAVDTYIYDSQGQVLQHTQEALDGTEAITVYYSYDKNGNLRYSIDGNGNETEYIYSKLNKLAKERRTISGAVQETGYTYDANGNQTTVTDWRGNITTKSYDSLNRLIETRDAYGISIQKLEYNHNNSQEKAYDALNGITRYIYDRNNRLVSEISPESRETSWTYDSAGNLETKKDGKSNSTAYTYDEHNRLIAVTNAKNETTAYTYDPNGNLLSQTDAKGGTTSYEYNVANKATRRTDQGGRTGTPGNYTYNPGKTETYTYNADGSLAAKTDRNGIITAYAYDIHGRLLSETAGEERIAYTYDKNGNRLTMTDGTGTTARTYDELNRVLTKEVPDIGKSVYTYDIISGMETGCWAETAADPKGNVTKKKFDRTARLKAVTADGKTTVYTYFDNGARQSVSYSDGSGEEYTYTPDGLLQALTNRKTDGSLIDAYSYTYDAANNQTSKTDARGTTVYTYDVLNRLETVTEPNGTVTAYTYDKAGNRETETIRQGANTILNTYNYNQQNRLLQVMVTQNGTLTGTTEYTYDSNGNQLATTVNGTVKIINSYDLRNQLVRTFTSAATVENRYNAEGYRVEKKVNGAITRYLYEYDKVVLEIDGAGQQTGRNVYGTNLLMRTADGTSYYYMYNGHADVTALLRPDGSIAATYYYDAFGNITDTTGSASNSITYAGYQYDKETGLYYLNARMYDPKTARFVQEDTYRGEQNDPLSLNLYTYCSNEPLMYTDPTGHISLSWIKGKVIDPLYNAGSNVASGAKKLGKKVVNKAVETWDYVSDKAGEAWDASTSYASEKASEAYTSLKNDAKAVKQWAKTQVANTKEGFTTLTNSKKRKEAFELIDTYGSESDKILARVAAGTAVVAGTTAVAATAVYAAPLIAAAGASITTSIMASSAATFAVANAEAVAWGSVGLVGGGIAVKSDIENKEYGQIPMDLATAVLGALMLKGTASSYRSTVGVKPNVGVNGGSRLKPNYQQFADDAGVGEVNVGKSLLPGEGNVGTYKDLVKSGSRGDNLTPHHMPSAEYMRENYGVPKNYGVSMNMEQPSPGAGGRHRITRSYGNGSDLTETPRDTLARDIMDARRIYQNDGLYTPEIRGSLQDVIDTNKRLFPEIFKKPGR